MMKDIAKLFGSTLVIVLLLVTSAHADLIISQYYDGTGANDKFIELTNVGSTAIDLTSPQLYLHYLENPDADPSDDAPTTVETLSGTVQAGATLLLRNPNSSAPGYATGAQTSFAVYFTGDDIIALSEGDGHTWNLDGSVDSEATSLGNEDGLFAWIGVSNDVLYFANTPAPGAGGDVHVFVSDSPGALTGMPWAKSGQIAQWDYYLANEYNGGNDSGDFMGWSSTPTNGAFFNGTNPGANEATIPIGDNWPSATSLYIVFVEFGTNDGDGVNGTVPTDIDFTGNEIDASEWYEINLATQERGAWARRLDVIGTPNSTWAASDVSYVRSHDDQTQSTTYTSGNWLTKTVNDVDTAVSDSSEYLGTHRFGDTSTTAAIATSTWKIIGLPFDLAVAADGVPGAIFGDDMSGTGYGNGGWIVSRYNMDNNSYDRFLENSQDGGLPALMAPGLGYWFIQASGSDATLDLDIADNLGEPISDVTVSASLPDGTATRRGLQMFANPFNQSFTVSSMTFDGGKTWANATNDAHADYLDLNANIYTWDGSQYVTTSYTTATLSAWEGFWLARATSSEGDGDVDVTFPTSGAGAGPMASLDELDEPGDWQVRVEVASTDGQFIDSYNRFGIKAVSREGYDAFDAYELTPPENAYVSLAFPHDDWAGESGNYTFDYRHQPVKDRKVWHARVTMNNVPNREFELTWPEINELPDGYTIELHGSLGTEGNGFLCDLTESDAYTFSSGPDASETLDLYFVVVPDEDDADFSTTVGEVESGMPERFEIVSAYPNPFNDELRMRIALPDASTLRAEVFDLLGRRVATLTDSHHGAGYHDLTWKASGAASGVYFLHVQANGEQQLQKIVLAR